jgi:hypothetical protein
MTEAFLRSLAAAEEAIAARKLKAGDTTYTDAEGRYHLARAAAFTAEADRLATPPPVDPPPVDPPPVDPPPVDPPPTSKDTTSPLIVRAGETQSGWRVHDITGTGYPTAVDMLEGATFADSVIEDCWQALFAARAVTVRNVRVRRAGVPGQQAHIFYVRHGLLDAAIAESFKPDAGHGSEAFHGHEEGGPVSDLEWRNCQDLTPNDSSMAGYVRVERVKAVQFFKPRGKYRVGVPGVANGTIDINCREVDNLQLDGTFENGSRVSGLVHMISTGGGSGMSVAQAQASWPTVDFSGLTIG